MSNFKCPHCGKGHYKEGLHTVTAMYFPPVYKNGVNVNPDRNWHTIECECLECHHKFRVSTNGVSTNTEDLGEVEYTKPYFTNLNMPNTEVLSNKNFDGGDMHTFTETFMEHKKNPQAEIDIGGIHVQVTNHFTKKQIKNIKKYFGWDAKNID